MAKISYIKDMDKQIEKWTKENGNKPMSFHGPDEKLIPLTKENWDNFLAKTLPKKVDKPTK